MPFPTTRRLLADIFVHLCLTAALAVIVFFESRKLVYVGMVVLGGIAVDLDHLIEQYRYFGKQYRITKLISCDNLRSGKIYLWFHAWEWALTILVLAALTGSPALVCLFLGLSLHYAVDNIQRSDPWFYFLSYRIAKRFEAKHLLPEYGPW